MATLQQDILVKIDTLINGLPAFRAFSEGMQKLKGSDGKKISLGDPAQTQQLAVSIERLATAVEKIDDKHVGRIGQALKGLVFTVSVLSNIPAAFDGLKLIKSFAQESPALAAKLTGAGAGVRGFFSAFGDKVGAGAAAVKTKISSLAEGLPKLSGGLLGVGAAGTVAAGGLLAVAGAVAAIVVAAIAIPAIVVTLFNLAKSAADVGDHFDELSKRTGVSIEILSALAPVLEDSGSSADEFANAMSKLNKKIGEAAGGSKDAKEDLKRFGIEPLEAINNQEAALAKVFKRIVDLPPGIQRGIAAQQAFGKSGDKFVATIEAINGDLDAQIQKTKALGLLWTGPAGKAAGEFNDKLAEIHRIVAGLAISIGQVLIPQILKLLRIMTHEAPQAGGAFATALRAVGSAAAFAVRQVIFLLALLKTVADHPIKSILAGTLAGPLVAKGLFTALKNNFDEFNKIGNTPSPDATGSNTDLDFSGGGGGSKKKSKPEDTFESILGFNRAAADSAVALLKDSLDRQLKVVEESFEKRKITISEFYDEQLRIQRTALTLEIDSLKQSILDQRDQLAHNIEKINDDDSLSDADRTAKIQIATKETQTTIVGLNERLVILLRNRNQLAGDLVDKELAAGRALQDQLQPAIDAIDRAKGLGPLVDIRQQIGELDRQILELRANGEEFAAELLEEWREVLATVGQVYGKIAQGQRAQEVLDARINTIRESSSRNLVTQFLGEKAIIELHKQKIAIAEETLRSAEALAQKSTDPAVLIALENQRAAVARLKNEYRTLGQTIKDTFIDSATRGIEDFLLSLGALFTGVKSLGDIFRAVALSIIEDISRIIAKMIALKIITAVIGIFGGGGGATGGAGSALGDIVKGFGFAAGGGVSARPGGRLINVAEGGHDELVVTTDPSFAQRTAGLLGRFIHRTGILPRFNALNSGSILSNISSRIPSFAAGDFISAPNFANPALGSGPINLTVQQVFPNVRDARGFKLNEAAMTREAGRSLESAMKKLRGAPDR